MTVKTHNAEEVNCCPSLVSRDGPVLTPATIPVTDPARGGEDSSDGHASRKEAGQSVPRRTRTVHRKECCDECVETSRSARKPALLSVRSVQLPVRKPHVPRGELADSTQKPAVIP